MIKEPKVGMRVVITDETMTICDVGDTGKIIKINRRGRPDVKMEKDGAVWDLYPSRLAEIKEDKMTLGEKKQKALLTSRQKWVKYPKEVVKSKDACGFCEEFNPKFFNSRIRGGCGLCKALFWGGKSCVEFIEVDCDSNDVCWKPTCDTMQARFDKIEVMEIKVIHQTRVWFKNDCCVCGGTGTEYKINGHAFCKTCLDKISLDMSEYDEKVEKKPEKACKCEGELIAVKIGSLRVYDEMPQSGRFIAVWHTTPMFSTTFKWVGGDLQIYDFSNREFVDARKHEGYFIGEHVVYLA